MEKRAQGDTVSHKILLITLIIIIFVTLLGTYTVLNSISDRSHEESREGNIDGYISIEIKQPSQENIKVGETVYVSNE